MGQGRLSLHTPVQSFFKDLFFNVISNKNDFTLSDFAVHPRATQFDFTIGPYRLKNNFVRFAFQIENALDPVDLISAKK